ncbi:hypothetical protein [Paraburkholderia adhaesiva]|uniref:hypothetical protein n=1 Tax=Paraburkholderia adhaesiva TaxID=2883244 RepID=UPI001F2CCD97|nr:hypothetical protein [Paraburkholderia adhaesiva]
MSATVSIQNHSHPAQGQAHDVRLITIDERDALIISASNVDGRWVVRSRYGDDVWMLSGSPTNVMASLSKLNFLSIPDVFREVAKAMLYRFLQRGREGQKKPGPSAMRQLLVYWKPFLTYLTSLGVESLSGITPMVCANYVRVTREATSTNRGRPTRGQSLAKKTLALNFGAVEALHELSQYTCDRMPNHPWADTSASYLAGIVGPGRDDSENKTPLIPDDVFTILFQRAWGIVDGGNQLLDIRDEIDDIGSRSRHLSIAGVKKRKNRALKLRGWSGGLASLETALLELRTACYVVVASLSGCRNHELAFLQSASYYSTKQDGDVYWWMRSKSTKTGEGVTEWMIPEAVVTALKIMDRWALPYQSRLQAELQSRRAANPHDVEIAEAQKHIGAIFLGWHSKSDMVRTLSRRSWGHHLTEFAEACGVDWALATHQFRRKFANYAARSQFGDLRYLKEHFKHWSQDMTLRYALNESQEMALYLEIQEELDEIKEGVVGTWLDPSEPLAGGYGKNIIAWRQRDEPVTLFKDRQQMIRSIAESTQIRSNGHGWCTAGDNLCVGNDVDPTRCADDCKNAVVGSRHAHLYQRLYDDLREVERLDDIGEGGRARVRRDMHRCRNVLMTLGYDPERGSL